MAGGPNEVADSTAGWAKLQLASEAAAGGMGCPIFRDKLKGTTGK